MAKSKQFDLDVPTSATEEEDDKTLAAIDEGIRDAKMGRTLAADEVRKLVPQWTTASSTRKKR
jgi:predicted transcriptional regulator